MALADTVRSILSFDISPEMLDVAKQKLINKKNISFKSGNILHFPALNTSADAILINQILHHLGINNYDDRQENHNFIVLKRVWEVLRPNGVVIINTSTQVQATDGFWWADLIPDAVAKICQRFPSSDMIRNILTEIGFINIRAFIPIDEYLQQDDYLNPEGPLLDHWRNADSTWSLTTADELKNAIERVKKMNEDGTIFEYLDRREKLRELVGQTTFFVANKPA